MCAGAIKGSETAPRMGNSNRASRPWTAWPVRASSGTRPRKDVAAPTAVAKSSHASRSVCHDHKTRLPNIKIILPRTERHDGSGSRQSHPSLYSVCAHSYPRARRSPRIPRCVPAAMGVAHAPQLRAASEVLSDARQQLWDMHCLHTCCPFDAHSVSPDELPSARTLWKIASKTS